MAHTRRSDRLIPWFSTDPSTADDEWIIYPGKHAKTNPDLPTGDSTADPLAESIADDVVRQGVIAIVQRDDRFLVIRRSHFVRAPRRFCFPGGGIESGESQIDAVQREMQEELNVEVRPVRAVWQSQSPTGVELFWWKTEVLSERIRPNPAEVESVYWMTVDHILSEHKLLDTNRQFLLALRRGEVEL
jgi:8-oxo-dGTP pyrophosphatase MutT (NUDIX family)